MINGQMIYRKIEPLGIALSAIGLGGHEYMPPRQLRSQPELRVDSITTPDLDIRHENDYGNFQYSRFAKGYRGQCKVF